MKSVATVMLCVVVFAAGLTYLSSRQGHGWEGVDKSVVEKHAQAAGHPARAPFINTDQGDLLLFFFLVAGAAGGFVAGYCFRELFPPANKETKP